jgi:hypothetical protein
MGHLVAAPDKFRGTADAAQAAAAAARGARRAGWPAGQSRRYLPRTGAMNCSPPFVVSFAVLDFSGNADSTGLMHTGHYQLDGTFTDWQSRIESVSRTLLRSTVTAPPRGPADPLTLSLLLGVGASHPDGILHDGGCA